MSAKSELERDFRDLEMRIGRLKRADAELRSLGTSEWRDENTSQISAIVATIKNPCRVDRQGADTTSVLHMHTI